MAETLKEKENDVEEKAEISKNAQFRAIQPSPSILSYVEDNVICMTGVLMFGYKCLCSVFSLFNSCNMIYLLFAVVGP